MEQFVKSLYAQNVYTHFGALLKDVISKTIPEPLEGETAADKMAENQLLTHFFILSKRTCRSITTQMILGLIAAYPSTHHRLSYGEVRQFALKLAQEDFDTHLLERSL